MESMSSIDMPTASEFFENDPDVFLVGRGFTLVGEVRGRGLCVVDGVIDGVLDTVDVKINSQGSVNGELKCSRLDVNGRIKGVVDANEVILRSQANVEGKLTYAIISMESGAIVDGEIRCSKLRDSAPTS